MEHNERKTAAPGSGRGFGPGHGHGSMPGESSKDMKKALGQLVQYSRRELPMIIVAMVCAITSAILTLVGPGMLSKITALITAGLGTGIDIPAVVSLCMVLAVLYGISALMGFVQGFSMASVT